VTIQPARSSNSRSAGISFDLSCTFACAKTSRCSLAHTALQVYFGAWFAVIGAIGTLPSTAITWIPIHSPVASPILQSSLRIASGQSVQIPVGTCLLGIPLARTRNVDNQACLLTPYNSMSSQPSPPAITDRIAIVKISDNRCKRVRSTRGSSIVANTFVGAGSEQWLCSSNGRVGRGWAESANPGAWVESGAEGSVWSSLRFSVRSRVKTEQTVFSDNLQTA